MAVIVVEPSPIVLPDWFEPRRAAPRPEESQQPHYLSRFDDRTVLYDTFSIGSDVVLSGPPLANLRMWFSPTTLVVDGHPVPGKATMRDIPRTQRSLIQGVRGATTVGFRPDGRRAVTSQVGDDLSHLFAGTRALVTMSKDNDLQWIKDWVTFYHRVHGIDAVLIYDNNTSAYSPKQLAAAIDTVPGVRSGVVVSWNFPYGPGGGHDNVWDSDFCQYSALEHAKLRFLREAHSVTNADVDELVVTDDGESVVAHAERSSEGILVYAGRWVDQVTQTPMDPARVPRFIDYRFHSGRGATTKWTLLPARLGLVPQWGVHSVSGVNHEISTSIQHRHFAGVNTNWKYDRTEGLVDVAIHQRDALLDRDLLRAFGSAAEH